MPNKLPAANVPVPAQAEGQRLQGAASAGSFSWTMARLLLEYSAKAYEPFVGQFLISDKNTDATALIAERVDEQCLIIAFKGSSTPEDFIQDAKFDLRRLWWRLGTNGRVKVHAGFLQDFATISAKIVSQIEKYLARNPSGKIFITGHSLGGALAILCALELSVRKIRVGGVYTFGQPRVGNKSFARTYNAHLGDVTFAVTNADDPIPLLPPLLSGYRDTGIEVFLPTPCAGWPNCPHCPRAVFNPWIGLQIFDDVLGAVAAWRQHKLAFIPNHLLNAYKEKLA
jgi:pimeloyl-ACP methyl ester carboxylesterase